MVVRLSWRSAWWVSGFGVMVVVDEISGGGCFLWLLLVVFGGFFVCVCVFFFFVFLVVAISCGCWM